MLKLITFPAGLSEPSMSPFCTKAMILLNMSGQNWQPEIVSTPTLSPTKKLPALRVGDRIIPDSNQILAWLEQNGAELFPRLSEAEKTQAHMLIRMVEENLRYGLLHDRWLDAGNWGQVRPVLFKDIPWPVSAVVPHVVRNQVRQATLAQGLTRLPEAGRLSNLGADLEALTMQLGDQPYLFGDQPCAADASALPVLSSIDNLPKQTPLRRMLRENTGLMRYIERGRAEIYPDPVSAISAAA